MISIQDTTGTLSAADVAALRTHQAGLSYRILVTAAGSRAELDAAAGRLVTSSDGIGIALDPVHHQVYTHFGVGTGISGLLMDRTNENDVVEIKPGDVVRLKSSGPDMTVERVGENGAVCLWFPGDDPSAAMVATPARYEFPLVCLERLED